MNATTTDNLFSIDTGKGFVYYFAGRKVRVSKSRPYTCALVSLSGAIISYHSREDLALKAQGGKYVGPSIRKPIIDVTDDAQMVADLKASQKVIDAAIRKQKKFVKNLNLPAGISVSSYGDDYQVSISDYENPLDLGARCSGDHLLGTPAVRDYIDAEAPRQIKVVAGPTVEQAEVERQFQAAIEELADLLDHAATAAEAYQMPQPRVTFDDDWAFHVEVGSRSVYVGFKFEPVAKVAELALHLDRQDWIIETDDSRVLGILAQVGIS